MCYCHHYIVVRISNKWYAQDKIQIPGKPDNSNNQLSKMLSFWTQVLISEKSIYFFFLRSTRKSSRRNQDVSFLSIEKMVSYVWVFPAHHCFLTPR